MRKIVLQLMTTLNGRVDDPGAWVFGVPEDVYSEINRVYATLDTLLVGHNTYHEMVSYWPSAADEEGSTDTVKSMAHKMNSYKKFMVTSSDEKKPLGWNNVEQVTIHSDDDLVRFISDLKAQPGSDIMVTGGSRLAQTFSRLGLIEEYRFFVYPVVSAGQSWFDSIQDKRDLQLISATPYQNGIVGLYYRPT